MRLVTERFSIGSICLVGKYCTFLINWAAVFMGAVFTALRRKSCLSTLTERCLELCGRELFVPRECREWIGLLFLRFLLCKDIYSAQQEDVGAWYLACNSSWYSAVNVASLVIVVTRRKGSDASFLVQAGKVSTYECHNFGICVVLLRPSIIFFPVPGATGSRSFGSLSLSLQACQSLMEVFVGHQNEKLNPPLWQPQAVPWPSMISMLIVGL